MVHRIGLFTECFRPIQNGIVASVEALAHAIRSRGYEAVVVTPEMPGYRDDDPNVVRVPSLPLPTRTSYRLTVPFVPREAATFTVVHTHSPFVTGWLGQRVARRNRVPLVFTYHTQLEAYAHYVPFEARAARSAATQLTRTYANAADAVVVPTATMERRLREFGVRSRIEIVPSGIDVSFFARGRRSDEARRAFGVGPGEKMVLFVGRLGREKNVELALEAFGRLDDPSARFVAIGDGTHREALERFARRGGVADRTLFAGELARERLPEAYACADALLFPSSTETQGLVLVEALAAGVPVVAVDTPQTRDVLGGAGELVSARADAMAAALREALGSQSPGREIGRQIAERYDRATFGDRTLDLYESLLAEREAAPA